MASEHTLVHEPAAQLAVDGGLPWVEKYRPKSLDELISHQNIIATLEKLIAANQLPHLLLYGPPGTGKTSTILAMARRIFGANYKSMILELNASDDRGIDVVRDQIKEFASTRSVFSSAFKLIVLDEADALTKVAQAALRRIIEMYSKSTRFCLICNYVSNIIPALQSRCMRLRFAPLEVDQIEARLNVVLERENVTLTPDGRVALLRLSRGDMRRCLNILQSASMASAVVDGEAVYTCTGHPMPSDITLILTWLLNESFATAFANVESLKVEKGLALVDVVSELHGVGVLRIKLSSAIKCFLYKELADLEHRMATSTSERIQLGSLVGMFQVAKRMIKDEMQAALAGADALAEGAHVRQ